MVKICFLDATREAPVLVPDTLMTDIWRVLSHYKDYRNIPRERERY